MAVNHLSATMPAGSSQEARPAEDWARRGDRLDQRSKASEEFMAVKKPAAKKKAAKKFKGVRRER